MTEGFPLVNAAKATQKTNNPSSTTWA